jgi:hypothetical protein
MDIAQRRLQRQQWHAGKKATPVQAVQESRDERRKLWSRAGHAVRFAVKHKLLRPWPICAVWSCNQWRVHAHHPSYAPDAWLDVVWLCRRHHMQLHREHQTAQKLRG